MNVIFLCILFINLLLLQNLGYSTEEIEQIILLESLTAVTEQNATNSFYELIKATGIGNQQQLASEKHECGKSSYFPPPQNDQQLGKKWPRLINVIHGHLVPNATDLPWMAVLFFQSQGILWKTCTATIISKSFLLTAGHCIADIYWTNGTGPWPPLATNRFSMLAGVVDSDNGTRTKNRKFEGNQQQIWRHSKRVFPHPEYKYDLAWRMTPNDIALIELELPLEFNERVSPICLSGPSTINELELLEAVVAGWGMIVRQPGNKTHYLHDGFVHEIPWAKCERFDPKFDSERAICAAGNAKGDDDPCKGDSGGPMMRKRSADQWVQIGIISGSFGYGCRPPDLMTRISHYCVWIKEIANVSCI